MTTNIVHQLTPMKVAATQETARPSTTAAMRWALADSDRTIVLSTTSNAAIGA
jgi:hypothetical protein